MFRSLFWQAFFARMYIRLFLRKSAKLEEITHPKACMEVLHAYKHAYDQLLEDNKELMRQLRFFQRDHDAGDALHDSQKYAFTLLKAELKRTVPGNRYMKETGRILLEGYEKEMVVDRIVFDSMLLRLKKLNMWDILEKQARERYGDKGPLPKIPGR